MNGNLETKIQSNAPDARGMIGIKQKTKSMMVINMITKYMQNIMEALKND
jgi:hypothetical protein